MGADVDYRKLAFGYYAPICAHCGFGVPEILEVVHLVEQRSANSCIVCGVSAVYAFAVTRTRSAS